MKPRAQSFKDCLPFPSSISFHPYFSSIPLSCASFGKLISSGRRWKFCTKLAKLFNPPQAPQRRLPSHLYAFTVFDLFAQNLNGKTAGAPGPVPPKIKRGRFLFALEVRFCCLPFNFSSFFGHPTPNARFDWNIWLRNAGALFTQFDRLLNKLNWFAFADQFWINQVKMLLSYPMASLSLPFWRPNCQAELAGRKKKCTGNNKQTNKTGQKRWGSVAGGAEHFNNLNWLICAAYTVITPLAFYLPASFIICLARRFKVISPPRCHGSKVCFYPHPQTDPDPHKTSP